MRLAVLDQRHRSVLRTSHRKIDLNADDAWQVIDGNPASYAGLMMRERAPYSSRSPRLARARLAVLTSPASAGDSSIILARRGLNERSRSSSVGITHSKPCCRVVHQVANPVEHGLWPPTPDDFTSEGYLAHAGML